MRVASCLWMVALGGALAMLPGIPRDARAQGTAAVRGAVTDSVSQQPIPGAQVQIVGTTRGTLTGENGRYALRGLPSGTVTVRVQRIGYAPVERRVTLAAGDSAVVDFSLRAVAASLGEVVVVGYGTSSRAQVTGAVSTVTAQEIQNKPVAGVDAALQGKSPGVQVTQNSGDPGNGISVRVRGAASISASNQPLFVIDGVPVQGESFAQLGPNGQDLSGITGIDPSEIESISVLKDAASAAIYGSRASNGVVMITTKRGQQGKARFTIDAYTGWQNTAKRLSLMNAQQYVEYMHEAAVNDGYNPAKYDLVPGVNDTINTDWQSAIFRTAPVSNVHLGISGGNERVLYNVSGSFFDQQGIVIGSAYQRASGRVNLDFDANEKLRFKTSVGLSRENDHRIPGDNSLDGVVTNAIGNPSNYPLRNPDGSFFSPDDGLYLSNSVAIATFNNLPTSTDRVLGNVEATYTFTPHLMLTGRVGADILSMHELQWQSPLVIGTYAAGAGGVAKDGYSTGNKYLMESFLNYTRGDETGSSLSVVGGASVEYNKSHWNFVRGEGFSSSQFHYVSNATTITTFDGLPSEHNLLSFFSRANYSYKDRYLLSASIRADGSSRFGPNNKYGVFPAISAGWVITDEPFMGDLGRKIGAFKLRASYGATGNQSIPNYGYLPTFGSSNYGSNPGIAPSTFANPNLKWESTREFDAGFDWSPFGGRLSIIADYYHKLTSNLLVDRPIPATSGYTSYWDNIGNVLNRGFEFGVQSVNVQPSTRGGFEWRTDFNISTNHNEVTALFQDQPFGDGNNFRPISRVQVGQPIGAFYVRRFLGVDPQTGDAMYSPDREIIGSPQPKYWGGLGNTVSWKGFELRGFLEFSQGAKVFNLMRIFADDGGYNYDNKFTYALKRWQKPGDITDEPRASFDGESGGRVISSRFIEDGSYLRIQEVTLSWQIPAQLARGNNARLVVSGHNLHNFTKYTGYDPDVNSMGSTSNIGLGTDYYAYPRARSITIGISSAW